MFYALLGILGLNRIPLTDEDVKVNHCDDCECGNYVVQIHTKSFEDSKEAEQFKKQILDDYEFREKDMICPQYRLTVTQYKELKEKAETYDALGDIIGQVNQLLRENKILKEVNEANNEERIKYKEIVQKVRELAKHYLVYSDTKFHFKLKEILE